MSYIKKLVFATMVLSGLWLSLTYIAQAAQAADPACKIECKTCASTCEQTLNYCRKQEDMWILST